MSKFEVIRGVEGLCLVLDDVRIAGPKPWGGGAVIHTWDAGDDYAKVETCEYKPMWNDDDLITGEYVGMWYTGCGDALIWNYDNDECCKPPAFCPYCGGAVKAVER